MDMILRRFWEEAIQESREGKKEIPMAFDGVHLSEEGHRIFAERILQFLESEKMAENQKDENTQTGGSIWQKK